MSSHAPRSSRVVLVALAVGAFFTAQEVLMDVAGRRGDRAGQDVINGFEFWIVWAFLAPIGLAALRRWPLHARARRGALLAHGSIALSLAVLHNFVTLAINAFARAVQNGMSVGAAVSQSASAVAFVWGVFTGVVFYSVVVMVYTALELRRMYVAEQLGAAALKAELTQSKLESLRAQLRPHFLFNTLNAISVFVTEDATKAQEMILRLSTLLRRSLDEGANEVPLQQELGFVNDYLDIQRGRFGDRLVVRLDVDPAALTARVPVFLLQPLLENAIEHGKSEDGVTSIAMSARCERDRLHLTLADDGPGVAVSTREGIGLGNTRARLRHLYGSQASVELTASEQRNGNPGTRVDITLPFRAGA